MHQVEALALPAVSLLMQVVFYVGKILVFNRDYLSLLKPQLFSIPYLL
jgi:hypothetical protein